MTRIANRFSLAQLALLFVLGLGFSAPTVLADDHGGTWTKRYKTIKGTWSIVETDEGRFLELDDTSKTRNAPD
ncbi:MAG: hypothetical protein AB8G17_13560, partial [Gammaproteobacteria bacterium]